MNWPADFTFPERYYVCGIFDAIEEFCYRTNRRYIDIVDVGCSTGVALLDLKTRLQSLGISSHVRGIDCSQQVEEAGGQNLVEFILGDITKMGNPDHAADVVICWAVANNVTPKHRAEILDASSKYVKADGMLITSANCFESTKLSIVMMEWIHSRFPLGSLRNGFKAFRKESDSRQIEIFVRRNRHILFGSVACAQYPFSVIEGWKKRDPIYRSVWIMHLAAIFSVEWVRRLFS
ncbi:MAG: class I SAM-dependent methyltransferase [Candidatus Methanomethylicaceae archaeon]|jgi:SAM-dependent methyltransferase